MSYKYTTLPLILLVVLVSVAVPAPAVTESIDRNRRSVEETTVGSTTVVDQGVKRPKVNHLEQCAHPDINKMAEVIRYKFENYHRDLDMRACFHRWLENIIDKECTFPLSNELWDSMTFRLLLCYPDPILCDLTKKNFDECFIEMSDSQMGMFTGLFSEVGMLCCKYGASQTAGEKVTVAPAVEQTTFAEQKTLGEQTTLAERTTLAEGTTLAEQTTVASATEQTTIEQTTVAQSTAIKEEAGKDSQTTVKMETIIEEPTVPTSAPPVAPATTVVISKYQAKAGVDVKNEPPVNVKNEPVVVKNEPVESRKNAGESKLYTNQRSGVKETTTAASTPSTVATASTTTITNRRIEGDKATSVNRPTVTAKPFDGTTKTTTVVIEKNVRRQVLLQRFMDPAFLVDLQNYLTEDTAKCSGWAMKQDANRVLARIEKIKNSQMKACFADWKKTAIETARYLKLSTAFEIPPDTLTDLTLQLYSCIVPSLCDSDNSMESCYSRRVPFHLELLRDVLVLMRNDVRTLCCFYSATAYTWSEWINSVRNITQAFSEHFLIIISFLIPTVASRNNVEFHCGWTI